MSCTPFITPRRRRLLDCYKRKAFCKLAGVDDCGNPITVNLYKYTANSSELVKLGDAVPAFGDAIPLPGIIESEATKETEKIWGVDTRTKRLVWMYFKDLTENSITNRDQLEFEGIRWNILSTHEEDGMGNEKFSVAVRVAPQSQVPVP